MLAGKPGSWPGRKVTICSEMAETRTFWPPHSRTSGGPIWAEGDNSSRKAGEGGRPPVGDVVAAWVELEPGRKEPEPLWNSLALKGTRVAPTSGSLVMVSGSAANWPE